MRLIAWFLHFAAPTPLSGARVQALMRRPLSPAVRAAVDAEKVEIRARYAACRCTASRAAADDTEDAAPEGFHAPTEG